MIERWRLMKAARTARCLEAPHPLGVELRVMIGDDDLRRSEVFRAKPAAAGAAAEWRAAFEQKGWEAPPARFTRAAVARALALAREARARVPGTGGMGHVLSYRLKVMEEALEVALDTTLSLDEPARERRLIEAAEALATAARGPEGQAFVKPIVDALT
jgi:hypothetical protein